MVPFSGVWHRFPRLHAPHLGCARSHTRASFNPFPFPTAPNPQPHDIFHLPRSATQEDIKHRYYDLVRIYHPDSIVARKEPAEESQRRIQAINNAYLTLRGHHIPSADGEHRTADSERHAASARFRTARMRRATNFEDVPGDERWKERTIVALAVVTLVGFVAQTTLTRLQVMKAGPPRPPRSTTASRVDDADLLSKPGRG